MQSNSILSSYKVTPFHLLPFSPWPFLVSIVLLCNSLSKVAWLTLGYPISLTLVFLLITLIIFWFSDILLEASTGHHTSYVQRGLYIGFIIFLLTEIKLFISFFWAFFHSSLNPDIAISSTWPPLGINFVYTWSLPLLGSTILLASAFVLTLSHHAFLLGNKTIAFFSLLLTIIIGSSFVVLQYFEYSFAEFTIADSVLGSVFFLTTGLHAIHVILGILFLLFSASRIILDYYSIEHAISFEFAILYYHLVDVVWLFVFLTYYFWGS